jgi:hypothetical protein
MNYGLVRSSSELWRGRARTEARDGEFTGEEPVGEEVLGSEAIAISSSLKLVLDEEAVTAELIPGLDGDGEGQWWPTTMSRDR